MRLEDVHLHDATIIRVIERPAKSVLAFELDYPEDWENEVYVAKTLIFRDPLEYRVDEGPFHGSPTLLEANIVSKGTRFAVVLETNAGRRSLSYSEVELLNGHGAV
jgi:hypothetical protein